MMSYFIILLNARANTGKRIIKCVCNLLVFIVHCIGHASLLRKQEVWRRVGVRAFRPLKTVANMFHLEIVDQISF